MIAGRRPLRTRGTRWAAWLSRSLLGMGVRPNQVSVFSVVFAAASAFCFYLISRGADSSFWLWMGAAAGIQGRLICNLMDGMLAVEGGLKTADGELYNEFPDRLSDPLILVTLGYAGGDANSILLGWLCATGSLLTAAVRLQGAAIAGTHDFSGPMAKPHRMALATGACLFMAVVEATHSTIGPLPWILGIMTLGIAITVIRRLVRLSRTLSTPPGS